MPGSGKTKVARRLAELLHRPFVDVDELIVRKAGRSIPDIFARDGEAHFRDLESKVIEGFSAGHCLVVATGGGSVLRERNRRLLQRNGLVLWLHRPLEELPSAGRPRLARTRRRGHFCRAGTDFPRPRPPHHHKPTVEDAVRQIIGEKS